jgi:hypothetical protein
MDTLQTQNTKPPEKPKDEWLEDVRQNFKEFREFKNYEGLLSECLRLSRIEKRDEHQEAQWQTINKKLTYSFILDNGALIATIPTDDEQKRGLWTIRQRLIDEYDCKTAAELILADEMATAYWRQMKCEAYVGRLLEKGLNQLRINALKEYRQQIEQAHRQIDVSLTMLKNLKQPQLKVNVKTDNAYFAQNQQVINEKPADKSPVETIKPK